MNLLKATNAANNLLQTHDSRTVNGNIKIDLTQPEIKNGVHSKENPSHTPRGTT